MPTYDYDFNPPAPVALVTLKQPEGDLKWEFVPMLMDTGADISLVPQRVLDQLGIQPYPGQSYELMGFDGNITMSPVVHLEMLFLHWTFRGQFLLTDQEVGILGRNILNAITLHFDGPNLFWDTTDR